jgi:hypothetical protein
VAKLRSRRGIRRGIGTIGGQSSLDDTFEQRHDELLEGPFGFRLMGDAGALPSIHMLRDKAWLDGKTLWDLSGHDVARGLYLDSLDKATRVQAASNFLIRL